MTAWHAFRVKPRAEGPALIGIEALGVRGFLPVMLVRKKYRGSREVTWLPLFPRYLFANVPHPNDISKILELDSVMSVLRDGDRLAPIPDGVIEAVRRIEQLGMFDNTRAARLGAGEKVRIIDGPFAGLITQVRSAKAIKRVEIVSNFVFRVSVDIDKLEKLRA